ncbi:MAG: nucleotide exchange factor GrpE [Armatimonadota bacterium]|nr:nucleotide exchange factor GrpE [Armatimonadota bacterium]
MTDERTAGGEVEEAGGGSTTVESLQAEVARLAGEAESAREAAERNWQQFLRAAADLENYRKQAARQREDAVAATRRAMLGIVLGVADVLERALAHAEGPGAGGGSNAGAIADGIRMAHRQVLDTLRSMGVRPMEVVGKPFDPRLHEAVEVVATDEGTPSDVIVAEIQRGYLIGEEVLRPARVRVAQ